MVETYLKNRNNLKAVVLLIDIRRIPGIEELNFIDWLKFYNIPCILILTKADKLSKNKQIIQEDKISQALSVNKEELILFSAKTRKGRDKVWAKIKENTRIEN
jgi:GTP-binding protein